jgi:hypothetical protein
VGQRFALDLYALNVDFQKVTTSGWNCAHSYNSVPPDPKYLDYISTCKSAGLLNFGTLPSKGDIAQGRQGLPEAEIRQYIDDMEATQNIAFWNLPEEQRYWKPDEFDIVKNYAAWTRKYDGSKRPNYMYIPGHYSAKDVAKYVPYLDILPASCYPNNNSTANAYVRWSIERTFEGIAIAQASVGRNYLVGDKTVMAILELFDEAGMSPEQSWHDFWLAVASDVRGIHVYAYHYRRTSKRLDQCWLKLDEAASKFSQAQLGRVLIEGQPLPSVAVQVTQGPQRTPRFKTPDDTMVDYPAVKVLAKVLGGTAYLIAVNSSPSGLEARFSGLPSGAPSLTALWEGRSIPTSNQTFDDRFEPYGVHVYSMPVQAVIGDGGGAPAADGGSEGHDGGLSATDAGVVSFDGGAQSPGHPVVVGPAENANPSSVGDRAASCGCFGGHRTASLWEWSLLAAAFWLFSTKPRRLTRPGRLVRY